ncbi:MAG: Cof-type HAD-IIB family hydrolase [Oscillospiraceae bacterium]|nr:Cof-type HAD-IIB family hydrolase [Oscillospiraceae bacterium]
MNIKMVVTDLDGTFLREDKTVSERMLNAFAQLREKGIKTVYATGRGESSIKLTSLLQFDGSVRNNGAIAYIQDKLIYERLLPADSIRDLLVTCDKEGIDIVAECGDMFYATFNIDEKYSWQVENEIVDFSKHNIDAEKLFAVVDSPEVLDIIKQNIKEDQYIYASRDDYALIMHKDATKSKGVASLAEYWNIDKSEIVAFGDDSNDTDMLEYCGIGIAMGNAIDEVKAVADQICDTNDNDGIAKWVEENLL